MVLFGGKFETQEKKTSEPLYSMPFSTYEFDRITLNKGPELRDSHSCVVVQGKMYVWGGCADEKV
jgi:hypothetical protein